MRKGEFTFIVMAVICLIAGYFPLTANTITVNNVGDSGIGSLRDAISNQANDGDTIVFDHALVNDSIFLSNGEIIIDKALVIIGLGRDSLAISGSGSSRIFNVSDTVSIYNLALLNGFSSDSGGAILNTSKLMLSNCDLSNSNAAEGGGIYNMGSIRVLNCLIHDNSATGSGGGIHSRASLYVNSSLISNNTAGDGGGGIAIYGSANTLTGTTVKNNIANTGGGIINFNLLTMTNCEINTNDANNGHGGGMMDSGNTKMTSCTISNNRVLNSSFMGGGLSTNNFMNIFNSTFQGNSSTGDGGGIANTNKLFLINSTINGNTTDGNGGGIHNSGTGTLVSSTVSSNTSDGDGGGIWNDQKISFENSTVSNNDADSDGGGCWTMDSLVFINTIFGINTAQNGGEIYSSSGTIISLGHNLVYNISQSGITPATGDLLGTNAIPVDPLLEPLQDNGGSTLTHALKCGSPAIDAGDATDAPSTDQRGEPRIHGDGIDIGAFEAQFDKVSATGIITNESAAGNMDGAIELVTSGGTPPYDYSWSTGSNASSISGLSAGLYRVTITDFFGCSAVEDFTVDIGTSAPAQSLNDISIAVYPNPANNFLQVRFKNNINFPLHIQLINANGVAVISKKASSNSLLPTHVVNVNVSQLASGNYWLVIEQNQTQEVFFTRTISIH